MKIDENICIGSLDLKLFGEREGIIQKRALETRGTRFLLDELTGKPQTELLYTAENKPYLREENLHISISHSHDRLAIITHRECNTGIDIELIREKVINIRHKFLSEKELAFAGEDPERLTACWAAKEAVYKAYGKKGVDFIRNMEVEDLTVKTEFQVKLNMPDKKANYLLRKERTGDYMMVYVLKENSDIQ